jgi:hypothetical protein
VSEGNRAGATPAVTAGEALAAIERERAAWEDLLAEVGDARMLEPGAMGDQVLEDLVAHLVAWDDRDLDRMEAVVHGQPEPAPAWPADLEDDDAINAWIHEQNADRLLGEVIDDSRRVYARLGEVVQALGDDGLNDPTRFPWMDGRSLGQAIAGPEASWFGHLHEDHEPSLRAWLATPRPPSAGPSVEL